MILGIAVMNGRDRAATLTLKVPDVPDVWDAVELFDATYNTDLWTIVHDSSRVGTTYRTGRYLLMLGPSADQSIHADIADANDVAYICNQYGIPEDDS